MAQLFAKANGNLPIASMAVHNEKILSDVATIFQQYEDKSWILVDVSPIIETYNSEKLLFERFLLFFSF